MMMLREGLNHDNPTVHVPPWSSFDDPTACIDSRLPVSGIVPGDGILDDAMLVAMKLCLGRDEEAEDEAAPLVDAYASDEFRMYEFKVRPCGRGRNHDWTECPFAHPGEKARRRDPRIYRYSGVPCPVFRKAGGCKRGDACEFAHGVFECWLHPDRYRTQPCKDGTACRRRVCFFAHTADQLRVVPQPKHSNSSTTAVGKSYDGSPLRQQPSLQSFLSKNIVSSPTSILISPPKSPPTESPPISPNSEKLRRASWQAGSPVNEIVASLRQLQLSRAKSMGSSYGLQTGSGEFASPRAALAGFNAGFCSLPSTPTATATGWLMKDEATTAERLESGRALRAKMFERLSKDGIFEKTPEAEPDVEWVSDLLK
ncbi:zinc finger CCCH domain-containing protein 35-like [Canna indica]|uniref:Zinc finger CCCH domain-containing protein 35-like n=1 Tax=Canna indica TaxID=4628 RepID=A0AAQ3Q2T9_9LILI|nr:zinc finger CCCH domain-containing protein 35-like [Canna indica]